MLKPVTLVALLLFVATICYHKRGYFHSTFTSYVVEEIHTSRILEGHVPFYMYEGPEFDIFLSKCTTDSSPIHHMGEHYFIQQMVNHPSRVMDPDKAVVFVVPIEIGNILSNGCKGMNKSHLEAAADVVAASPMYQRHWGWDHLIVSTHYLIRYGTPPKLKALMANFTVAHQGFIETPIWRCHVTASFSETQSNTDLPLQTVEEFKAARPYNLFFQGQADGRHDYRNRVRAMNELPGFMSPSVLITSSKKTKTPYPSCNDTFVEGCYELSPPEVFHQRMAMSKYNLFFRGDNFGSSRLADAMAEGTPSIIISDQMWAKGLPSHCQIPWKRMAFPIKESDYEDDPRKALSTFFDTWTDEKLQVAMETIRKYRQDMLWTIPHSRAGQNIIYNTAHRCIPEDILKSKNIDPSRLNCEFPDLTPTKVQTMKSHK